MGAVEGGVSFEGSFCITLCGEVGCFVEGYFVEVCFLDELGTVEGSFSSEGGFYITLGGEVSFSVEGYFVEDCFFGKLDAVEGCIPDKSRSAEICITVEFGGCENTFLNCEVIEGVENWCPTEIKIQFTP